MVFAFLNKMANAFIDENGRNIGICVSSSNNKVALPLNINTNKRLRVTDGTTGSTNTGNAFIDENGRNALVGLGTDGKIYNLQIDSSNNSLLIKKS